MSDDSPKIQKTDEKFAWLEKLWQCTTWLDQRIAQPEKTRFYLSRNETEAFAVVSSELEPMKHVQTDMIVVVMQRAAEGAVTKQTERFCNDQWKWKALL